MQSESKTVDLYLKEVPEKRMIALQKIRKLCIENLPDHTECMEYKMPSYKRKNQVEVAFASQKQHVSIYFLIHEVMLENEEKLKGLNHGKGCIRFSNPDKVDYDLLTYLLKETNKTDAKIC